MISMENDKSREPSDSTTAEFIGQSMKGIIQFLPKQRELGR